ncbi:hypothetical protein C8Q76DRAFT_861721 [Earliella scabrosa]|nr:hypothetical protein C8Q76DRAFT_861721 [Earliella scabrosa]
MSADNVMLHLQTAANVGVEINIGSLYYLQITKYFTVVALTLAIMENFSTLPDEVTHMWSSRLTSMKIMYFINKYAIFLDTSLAVTLAVWTRDPEQCNAQYHTLVYCSVIGIMVSEAILVTRTIALWNFNTYVKIFAICAYVEITSFAVYCVWYDPAWPEYPPRDILRIIGCVLSSQERDTWPAYGFLIIGETLIIMLTILRRFLDSVEPDHPGVKLHHTITCVLRRCYVGSESMESPLVKTLYRDGIHFYCIVLSFTIVNVLVILFGPEGLSLRILVRIIHSALCTRVILNLRKAAMDSTDLIAWDAWGGGAEQDEDTKRSILVFAQDPAEYESEEESR